MKAVLPLAGRGSRLFPIGITTPKCMVKILNKPLLEWTTNALVENGVDEIVLVVRPGKDGDKIMDFANSLDIAKKVKFLRAEQKEQLGTAHVLQMAKEHFEPGEQFLYLMGDDLYSPGTIKQIVEAKGLAAAAQEVCDPEKWGIFQVDGDGNMKQMWEKPETDVGNLANIACYKLDTRIFDVFERIELSPRDEYELPDSLNLLAKEAKIEVITATGYWQPVGYPWHLLLASNLLSKTMENRIEGEIEDDVVIKGKVILPKSSTIKSGTYIDGNLAVGENTVIGPNVHVRGNVSIGNDGKVGFGTEIKTSVIGDKVRISNSLIKNSVFGTNVNFPSSLTANYYDDVPEKTVVAREEQAKEIQTLVKDKLIGTGMKKLGCIIGDNVRVGIGTIFYPGVKMWPNASTEPGEIVKKDVVNQWK